MTKILAGCYTINGATLFKNVSLLTAEVIRNWI